LPTLDLNSPRTIGQILDTAFRVYARVPAMFVLLAGVVVIPYELLVLLVEQAKTVAASTTLLLVLADVAIVNPFIAALGMQVLLELAEEERPRFATVAARGLAALPVVVAAQIVSGLVEFAGLILFVIPGLFAAVRLAVAASAAAAERTSWPAAISRSLQLTQGNFLRVLGLLVIQNLLTYLVGSIIASGVGLVALLVGMALSVLAQSFCALLVNLLYFDLRARATMAVPW